MDIVIFQVPWIFSVDKAEEALEQQNQEHGKQVEVLRLSNRTLATKLSQQQEQAALKTTKDKEWKEMLQKQCETQIAQHRVIRNANMDGCDVCMKRS